MSRRDKILNLVMIAGLLLICIAVVGSPVNLEEQHIPEILSGTISGISLVIGFTGTVLALMFQKRGSKQLGVDLETAVLLLAIPILSLLMMYYYLAVGISLQIAFKWSIINLALSFCIHLSLLRTLVTES